ncbi:MAG: hypothetical protein QHI48_06630 [Bacteroidota bacterium]|nr:hypothetical protein [Bacteroidota bacterium]
MRTVPSGEPAGPKRMQAWTLAVTGIALAGGAVWLYVFSPIHAAVDVSPPAVYADGTSTAVVSIRLENRLGFRIPFSAPRLQCFPEEGEHLVSFRYEEDSTRVVVRAGLTPGTVVFRVRTPATPFPLLARLEIRSMTASSRRFPRRGMRCGGLCMERVAGGSSAKPAPSLRCL